MRYPAASVGVDLNRPTAHASLLGTILIYCSHQQCSVCFLFLFLCGLSTETIRWMRLTETPTMHLNTTNINLSYRTMNIKLKKSTAKLNIAPTGSALTTVQETLKNPESLKAFASEDLNSETVQIAWKNDEKACQRDMPRWKDNQ